MNLLYFVIFAIIKCFNCANTIPFTWNYQSTLLQCGQFGILVITSTTVPPSPGKNFTITYNRLVNVTTSFTPAIGLINFDYTFPAVNTHGYVITYPSIVNASSFKITVYAIGATPNLTSYTINYLAVSANFNDFYIWIETHSLTVGRTVTSSTPISSSVILSGTTLPSIANVKYIAPITYISMAIVNASTLFDFHITVSIINTTVYNATLSASLSSIGGYYWNFQVVFYQFVTIPYSQTLSVPISYSSGTPSTAIIQVIVPSNLGNDFFLTVDNSFFSLHRYAGAQSIIFGIVYTSNTTMNLSFTATQQLQGNIFTYKEPLPCPSTYVASDTVPQCVCNDISCYQGIGCTSVVAINKNVSTCTFCSAIGNFILAANGSCVCATGYQLNNTVCQAICGDGIIQKGEQCDDGNLINGDGCSSTCKIQPPPVCNLINSNSNCACNVGFKVENITCVQICGDGIKINDQCDDGNTISGDGCSSTCQIESGFQCNQDVSGTSVCYIKENICFTVASIQKNADNSAIFTFQAVGNSLPFNFTINTFVKQISLNLTIQKDNTTNFPIAYYISSVSGQTVKIFVEFTQTIQGSVGVISFDFNSTKYLSQDCILGFNCIGSGLPLAVLQNAQQYNLIDNLNLIFIVLLNLIFVVSMFAPKWIGIQAFQAIQLIFFSQLLISDVNNWPLDFMVFNYFKYSNGFNNIFDSSSVNAVTTNSRKWSFLKFNSIYIQNNGVNFLIIIFFISINFFISLFKKDKDEDIYLDGDNQIKIHQLKEPLKDKVSRKLLQVLVNIVVWSILQNLASIISQLQLLQYPYNTYNCFIPIQVNTLFIAASFFILVFILGNLFLNMLFDNLTISLSKKKPQLQIYKRANVIYHFILGIFIFYFNDKIIGGLPISFLFLFIELSYIIYLCKLQPYKQCLMIHSIGLFFSRFIFLGFLGFITMKNMYPNMKDAITLGICYIIVASVLLLIIFSVIRLYYDLRYGQELEIVLKQQREAKQIQYQQQEKKRIKALRIARMKKEELERQRNFYLFENQAEIDKQMQVLQWLQKMKNMTRIQKQKYYYERFKQKPLEWLKDHDQKEYQFRLQAIEQQNRQKKKGQKKNEKNELQHKQHKQLKQKMKKQCLGKKIGKQKKIKHQVKVK